jgi:flagellar motility protein MotE (MotC chaperone)
VNRFLRHIRLLPVVILVGFSLLTVKGFGLMHEARAADAGASAPAEQPGPTAQPTSTSGDPAADDTELASASEVDVLTSLTRRRKELDAREQKLAMRENVITAAEQRVDNKITQLQALQAAIQKLLGQRDAEEQKQIASLVKTYSAMKPKDAARIFDTLDEDVRITVAQQMKPDVLAPVLAAMQAEQAQKLTLKLADRFKVKTPDVPLATPPAAPAPDGTPATATTPASTTTSPAAAPAQTAAAAPAPAATPPVQLATNEPPKAPIMPKPVPHRATRRAVNAAAAAATAKLASTPSPSAAGRPTTTATTATQRPAASSPTASTTPAAAPKPATPQPTAPITPAPQPPAATPTPVPAQAATTAGNKPASVMSATPGSASAIKPALAPTTTTAPGTANNTAPAAPVVAKPGG